MHWDLVGKFAYSFCKAEGRDRCPVSFTVIPDYQGIQREWNCNRKPPFKTVID